MLLNRPNLEEIVRMSRPWVLVCLLLVIVFTSQFEWKQQYGNEIEASPNSSKRQQYMSEREESVKEKVSIYTHTLMFMYMYILFGVLVFLG